MSGPLRFAVIGCGFWSQYQLAGWREVGGAEPVAVYNRTFSRAEATAARFGIPTVYRDAEAMLAKERPDFVDIITDVDTHQRFVGLAAAHRVAAICQKPMAPDLATAEAMVQTCREAGVPFMVHENWRWQPAIRETKRALAEGGAGRPFRARITFSSSFPVFDRQPFLAQLERFILTDIGSHILDVARFLFGEARSLYCQTRRINPSIAGEDVATVMMEMGDGVTVVCEMSYASRTEHERFPETFVLIECERGAVELAPDLWVRVTTSAGTFARRCPTPRYPWADPAYGVVHASIVPCNAHLLESLRTGREAETSGADNLNTARLVFGAYESAAQNRVVALAGAGAVE
jgi:predicted dehydrogenase